MNMISRVWHLTDPVGNHKVQVCDNDISQEEAVTRYIQGGLMNGEAVIVLARPALRRALMSNIDVLGLDVKAMRNMGQIRCFDAELLLSSLQMDGVLDERAFQDRIITLLQVSRLQFDQIHVFCGMIDRVWKEKQSITAMQLESSWADLARTQEFSLLCSYSLDGLDAALYEESLQRIDECHRHLISYDSSEAATDQAAQDAFETAWNRGKERLATSPKLPSEITQTLLN